MTIKELKIIIAKLPDEMDVFIQKDTTGLPHDFEYNMLERASIKNIGFSESPDSKHLAKENVFILSDEINDFEIAEVQDTIRLSYE